MILMETAMTCFWIILPVVVYAVLSHKRIKELEKELEARRSIKRCEFFNEPIKEPKCTISKL